MRASLLLLLCAALAPACAAEPDDRPATAEYITPAILRPSCATASCHSSSTRAGGLSFETVEDACESAAFIGSGSFSVLDRTMPPDAPLPTADRELIETWLNAPTLEGCP